MPAKVKKKFDVITRELRYAFGELWPFGPNAFKPTYSKVENSLVTGEKENYWPFGPSVKIAAKAGGLAGLMAGTGSIALGTDVNLMDRSI